MEGFATDLRSIYLANGIGVFILSMLIYVSRARIFRHRAEDRVYSCMVVGVLLGCVMEAASYTLDGKAFPGARLFNYLANTYLFSMNLLLPFGVLIYFDLALYGDAGHICRRFMPQIIIGAALLLLTLLSLFVPIVYSIDERNVYARRPVGYVYYFAILYYCFSAWRVTKRYEKENGAMAFFNIHMFLIPIVLGVGLQFLFYGLSVGWLAAALGLAGLYMMQQNEMAYIDSLVDTYNRQYLNHVLSAWKTRGRTFAGVMLDVDHFKQINDQYGHSEGDRMLKTATDILKSARKDHEWVFRFAGDEFIMLKLTDDPDGLVPYMREVDRQVAEHNARGGAHLLSLSYGMSFFDFGETDAFIRQMDERMFQMKEAHHRANGE